MVESNDASKSTAIAHESAEPRGGGATDVRPENGELENRLGIRLNSHG